MAKRPGGTPEEELEAFTRRLIDEVEDFEYYRSQADWREFANDKFYRNTGRILSDKQVSALDDARLSLIDFEQRVGVRQVHPFKTRPDVVRYRDNTGEFQRRGTFVSRAQLAGRIDFLKRFGI